MADYRAPKDLLGPKAFNYASHCFAASLTLKAIGVDY